jgi:chlorobactene glucosyltransferase
MVPNQIRERDVGAEILTNILHGEESWIFLTLFAVLSVAWTTLAISYLKSYKRVNKSRQTADDLSGLPYLVSVIVPARNEEFYIKRCLASLLSQHYANFEVIMVDDGSTDNTLEVAKTIKDKRLKILEVKETPEGWRGKTWASQIGYMASKGRVLVYTDADSFFYNKFAIAKIISLMQKGQVQVVTGSPLIELKDFYSKMAMPLFNLFSVFRAPSYALKSHGKKLEHLIGGFFAIDKEVLDKIQGFTVVKASIQEDTDLGKYIKKAGFSIELIRVNNLLSALWSRNRRTLIDGINRIVAYNLRSNNKINTAVDISTIFGMVVLPYLLLPISTSVYKGNSANILIGLAMFFWNVLLCLAPAVGVALEGLTKYRLNPVYSLLVLFAAAFLLVVYLGNLLRLSVHSGYSKTVIWKDRKFAAQ